jgi:hypothetical protein
MKWLYRIFCYVVLLLLFVLLFFGLNSCQSTRRIRTTTTTVAAIRVDTIIHILYDKVPTVSVGTLNDTIIAENKTAIARSYYSPETKKITLELKGKPYDLPVKINQTTTEVKKEKDVVVKPNRHIPILVCLTLLLAFYGFLFIPRKK